MVEVYSNVTSASVFYQVKVVRYVDSLLGNRDATHIVMQNSGEAAFGPKLRVHVG